MPFLLDTFATLLPVIESDLHELLEPPAHYPPLFYRMLHYHMGWVDEEGNPIETERGKRIRPALALIVCNVLSGSYEAARPAAAAVELIHNFSLLHDDIQDASPLRRGRPSAWKIWGSEQAINAGDAMFALAYLAIPRLAAGDADPTILNGMSRILGETAVELTRGQHLDMMFEKRANVTTEDYLDMISGKTAALIAACAEMGALAGGADTEQQEHFRAYGLNLGLAFQVMDDVLDIWGKPEVTGKIEAVDIRQRKKSLPVLYALERSPDLHTLYASPEPMTDERVHEVIEQLDAVEARSYAEDLARQYSDATLAELEAASPEGDSADILYEVVDYLLKRTR